MIKIRTRAQAHFPTVLLTLISIIQALALELMWSKVSGIRSAYHEVNEGHDWDNWGPLLDDVLHTFFPTE